MDYDADGHTDIVTATFEGVVYVVRGSKSGWLEPVHVKDVQGRNIVLSMFYDFTNNKYDYADRTPKGAKTRNKHGDHCCSAIVWDWDADGDLDLLLGAKQGRLYLQRNEGKAGAPKYTGENVLLTAGGKPFNVPGGLTAPRLVDWDGDGVLDLVCGSFQGGVYFYRNTGKKGAPEFAAPVTLIARTANTDAPINPTSGVYADPIDYDGDGDLDLLVGGYANYMPKAPALTAEQKARADQLLVQRAKLYKQSRENYAALREKIKGLSTDEQRKARTEYYKTPAQQQLMKKLRAINKEYQTLRPSAKRQAGVWLYRRN